MLHQGSLIYEMSSTEERNRKPYALPVQCMPYKGLKDSEVMDIGNKVIQEMHKQGMKVAGMYFVSRAIVKGFL